MRVSVCVCRIFFASLLAVMVLYGSAQQVARLEGRVTDSGSLEPLPGATVLISPDRGIATDHEGFYTIELPPGLVDLTFQYVGYHKEFRQVTLIGGQTTRIDVALEPQMTQMDQVVVSAGRLEQRLSDLTVSLSIIQPQAFAVSHVNSIQEMMNRSSGVEVLDGQASIRGGSGFSYGAGSRVMVLVDGLPMLTADAGNVRWQALPLENLSQVEVIKGASSVLYGSSALNGIIHLRTADATAAGKTSFFAESGVYDQPGRKEWMWWDSPRLFHSASFSHLKQIGHTDLGVGSFVSLDNGYRKRNENRLGRLNLRLRHRCTRHAGLTYGLTVNGSYNSKRDFVLWENASIGALVQDPATAQLLHGSTLNIDPSIRYQGGGPFTHALKSRVMITKNDFPEGGSNNSQTRSWHTEYQVNFVPESGLVSISSGLMQVVNRIRSEFYGDHQAWNSAVFSQAEITLAERLRLAAGFRAEYNTLNGLSDKLVPLFRSGINYRLANLTFLRASYGQGYRFPSIAEKYAATTLGAVRIFPNPQVQPESGWNSEIGVKQGILTDNLEGLFDLAIFYGQNSDMIEYVFGIHNDPFTNEFGLGFTSTNIEHSRVYGLELDIMLNTIIKSLPFTFTGGYVLMHPVEFDPRTNKNTGAYLKFRRKHAANLQISTSFRKFEWGIHLLYRSRILDIDDVFVNPMTREDILPGFFDYWTSHNQGYVVADISLGYQLHPMYKLSLVVKNLANKEYMGRPGDIQPQRHVSLRVSGSL